MQEPTQIYNTKARILSFEETLNGKFVDMGLIFFMKEA